MPSVIDMRRVMVAAALGLAMVAFSIPPLCQLDGGCGMPADSLCHMGGAGLSCGLLAEYPGTAAATVPPRVDVGSLLGLALATAAVGSVLSAVTRRSNVVVTIRSGAPPPDTLGTRLLI